MNKSTRNTLRNTVTTCRRLLEESIAERLQGQFGLHADGRIEDAAGLTHLSPEEQAFRAQLVVHLEHIEAGGLRREAGKNKKQTARLQSQVSPETVAQLIREIAFTHLNRLAAYKLMETRGLIRESVSRGVKSQGFLFYLAQHPEDETLWRGGQQDLAYAHFLEWLGGTLSREIGVLFAPTDPANRLLPPQRVLDELLALLNSDDLAGIWDQDETIGWVYQYFTPKELRDQARKESRSPRNSYELSFRNQFYTPRYVVQFLTDNTLGRIWYEMRRGDTALVEQCAYLVRRPNEVFLEAGDLGLEAGDLGQASPQPPASNPQPPTPVPFRPKRDPRTLKILDPACGSGHFLLYAFDLLTTIYAEAYDDPQLGQSLQADYPDPAVYRRAVPGLILRYNLHGIDIDPRAIQIASLALWLKAKKGAGGLRLGAGGLGVEAGSRTQVPSLKSPIPSPTITKSNLVTAEPMPGSAALLREFTATLNPPVLGQLVEAVFDKMKLAGEAGALLKIEEELAEAIEAAKQQWLAGPKPEQLALWPDATPPTAEQLDMFDLTGISDAQFWDEAEGRVLAALQAYAEEAEAETSSPQRGELEGGDHYLARRLFADDAARGFAFIDLCRQRFDVVLMNPPFGAASKASKSYITRAFPRTKNDVYAAFVERWLDRLVDKGLLGAITSRTGFFLSSFRKWREDIILNIAYPTVFSDLGDGVLDTAMVKTAAYCLERGHKGQAIFINLIDSDKKDKVLLESITSFLKRNSTDIVRAINPEAFRKIPNSPFAHWIGDKIRDLFDNLPSFEPEFAEVRAGLQSLGADEVFIRVWWEVSAHSIGRSNRWVNFAKGGESTSWYDDVYLVTEWEDDGKRQKNYAIQKYNSVTRKIVGMTSYFQAGFTYTTYTNLGFSARVLPSDCIFSLAGSGIFPKERADFLWTLGLLNSNLTSFFLGLMTDGRKWEPGYVKSLPFKELSPEERWTLEQKVKNCIEITMAACQSDEVNRVFTNPALLCGKNGCLTKRIEFWIESSTRSVETLNTLQREIDDLAFKSYGIEGSSRQLIESRLGIDTDFDDSGEISDTEPLKSSMSLESDDLVMSLFSYTIGCIFTRWDIRIALDPTLAPPLQDPFEPLPVCPPGALVGPDGLPATPDTIVSEAWLRARPNAITLPPAGSVAQPTIPDSAYPLRLDWDGILVDDPDHQDDIVRQVRDVIELLWGAGEQDAGGQGNKVAESQGRRDAETNDQGQMTKDKGQVTPDDIEREACEILGVKALRDYFRKSGKGGFWDDHVKRYSKSRRKAPIYWLLQSSKKNYALWLYYHRLDGDLLYKALVNYVEPKIRLEEGRLDGLRQRLGSEGSALPARERRTLEKALSDQEDFVAELRDFEDKLRRAANLNLTPDLNDGVVLNIAPLWELVPWREAKKYWERLLAGQYEWSSIGAQLREKGVVG